MSDIEIIRKAATLMRERANAATPGPWSNRRGPGEHVVRADGGSVADTVWREDRRHIASWHPVVTLAVADWLDADVAKVERHRLAITFGGAPMFPPDPHAVAIARAYLGAQS